MSDRINLIKKGGEWKMESQKKEVYQRPLLVKQGLLRDVTAHCKSGRIDVNNNGCHD